MQALTISATPLTPSDRPRQHQGVSLVPEVLADWAHVVALASEWDELLERSQANTIFLRSEWMRAWLETVGDSVTPFVVTVRDAGGRLVGLAPFYVAEYRLAGVVRCRALRIVADHPTGAEYLEWIVDRDVESEATRCIANVLQEQRARWDFVWIRYVRNWTGARERIVDACRAAGLFCRERPVVFGQIVLPSTLLEYEATLSSDRRQGMRRKSRKVMGSSDTRIITCGSSAELPSFLRALFDLHARRWQSVGEPGTFLRKPNEARFYERFALTALTRGWLRFVALEQRGEIKAIQLGYLYDNTFHQIQEGFDPGAIPGIGNVLRIKVIEACIDEGVAAYDFLGGMTDHKSRWRAAERDGAHLLIGHGGARSRAIVAGGFWPTGKYLRLDRRCEKSLVGTPG